MGSAPQPDVFHDVAAKHLVELLMHHRHAVTQRVVGTGEVDLLAIHPDGTGVLFVDAKEALHQRGLARAVFAHQRVHRTRPQRQLGVVKRLDARKLFFYARHFQKRSLIPGRGLIPEGRLVAIHTHHHTYIYEYGEEARGRLFPRGSDASQPA
jgi:hypothetical protein